MCGGGGGVVGRAQSALVCVCVCACLTCGGAAERPRTMSGRRLRTHALRDWAVHNGRAHTVCMHCGGAVVRTLVCSRASVWRSVYAGRARANDASDARTHTNTHTACLPPASLTHKRACKPFTKIDARFAHGTRPDMPSARVDARAQTTDGGTASATPYGTCGIIHYSIRE